MKGYLHERRRRVTLSLELLATAMVLAGCGHNTAVEPGGTGLPGPVAQVWLTTADQTHLLSRQPDVPLLSRPDASAIRKWSASVPR
jgi:hypothetical protein